MRLPCTLAFELLARLVAIEDMLKVATGLWPALNRQFLNLLINVLDHFIKSEMNFFALPIVVLECLGEVNVWLFDDLEYKCINDFVTCVIGSI